MKKSFITKIAVAALTTAALLLNISCTNLISGNEQETVQEADKVLIQPSISDISRTVFPTTTTDNLELITLKFVKGKSNGTIAIYDDYKTFSNTVIALTPGDYEFTLTAKCGGVILEGKLDKKSYTASSTVQALNFNLAYDLSKAIATGEGNISYKFTYGKTKNITEANLKLFKCDANGNLPQYAWKNEKYTTATSAADGTHYIEYKSEKIPSGLYEMQFEIRSTDNKTATYRNVLYVVDGCTTTETYDFKDEYWFDKYTVGSVVYSNKSNHFKAVATDKGIEITISLKKDEKACEQIYIEEETSKIGICLATWNGVNDPRHLPTAKDASGNYLTNTSDSEVTVLYPFTEAGKTYLFNTIRDNGSWDTSEKVFVKATTTTNESKIFNSNYNNIYSNIAVTVSPDTFQVKQNTDWRNLFDANKLSSLSELTAKGQVMAGDKAWNNGSTTAETKLADGSTVYHKWVGERIESWEDGSMNLLTERGIKDFNKLLNGVSVTDNYAIANIKRLGQYWAKSGCEFKVNGNNTGYYIANIESDVVKAPAEDRITVTYVLNSYNKGENEAIMRSYKKGEVIELSEISNKVECKFAGWSKSRKNDGTDEILKTYNCSEDITLYGKWNNQVNNWQYIYNYKETDSEAEKKDKIDNYYTQFYLKRVDPDFSTKAVDGETLKTIIVTIKGKAVVDYEGKIETHITDYFDDTNRPAWATVNNSSIGENVGWSVKSHYNIENVSYKAGDNVELSLIYVPDAGKKPYVVNATPAVYLKGINKDNRKLFELSDVNYKIDYNPVKVTLVNTKSATETSTYYHSNTEVKLPETYSEQGLVLNSWHKLSDCSDAAITSITTTTDSTMKVYAKMDVKLKDDTWVNQTTGLRDGHYATGFYLDYLKKFATVTSNFTEYNLKKGDKVKLTFTGNPKVAYNDEFFLQVFDTGNEWVNSCEYKMYKTNTETTWDKTLVQNITAGTERTYVIETTITQEQFKSQNPFISFGYNYSNVNNKENSFSDWTIKLELIKAE